MTAIEVLNPDIAAAIQKNLPAVTAGVLTARLAKADADEKEVLRLGKEVDFARSSIDTLNTQLASMAARAKEHGDLLKREKDVAERERLQDLAMATVKLQMQTERINALEGLVSSVFRNKTLMETISRTVPVSVSGGSNSGGYVGSGQETGSRTVSET